MASPAVTGPPALGPAEVAEAGRALTAPFVLRMSGAPTFLSDGAAATGEVRLQCREILRLLPGRRLVARAEVDGRVCVVKLFLGARAARYRDREARGCACLAAAGVPTPRMLGELLGPDDGGVSGCGLLFDYLAAAAPLSAGDDAGFDAAAMALARVHQSGCRYRDLHLDNFLRSREGKVFVVDGDGVRRTASGSPLRRRSSLAELAVLCAQRPPLADDRLAEVDRAYAAGRGWPVDDPRRLRRLAALTVRQRRARVRRFLKKAQRDCTEFRHLRSWRRWVVAVRDAWDGDLAAFAADPEGALHDARVLKDGNSATVFRVRLGGRDLVVKRYNLKGAWHALRRALRPTARFRMAWLNGQRLRFLGIPTARPLALVENRVGPWRTVAYLAMEDQGDLDLGVEVETAGLAEQRLIQVVDLFRSLSAAGLVHGDTKASNFLVTAEGVVLVDLDAMREGGSADRDRRRFLDNFADAPEVRERFLRALEPGRYGRRGTSV